MKPWLIAALAVVVLIVLVALGGNVSPSPNPPGTFSFAVLGDAPYYIHEELRYRIVLRSLEAHDLASVIHLGDIWWRPCTDTMYLRTRGQFDALRHPVIYTPGDNEWTDCWEGGSGGFAPRERLNRLRQIFFAPPNRSRGGRAIALAHQRGEFVENARWQHEGIVFATVHLVGSANGLKAFPGRTTEDDAEVRRRVEAATAWMRETFAGAASAPAVVLVFHANLHAEEPRGHESRKPFEPFITSLEQEATRFRKPVLIVHGNDHEFIVDHPLRAVPNLTRLQVPGSPDVGWVRVTVNPRAAQPFAFANHVVPWWKYW